MAGNGCAGAGPTTGAAFASASSNRHTNRPVEARLCRCAVAIASHTVAGKRGHVALRGQLADGVVAGIGDVQIAGLIEGDARRRIERRRRTDPVGKAFAATGQRVHMAIRAQAADTVGVATIGDVERAPRIDRQAIRIGKPRVGGAAIRCATHATAGNPLQLRFPAQRRCDWCVRLRCRSRRR
ncbi:hypothetical protein FHR61_002502 [Xanthomonas arboricola]|uniref:Uncharacterized protein n=1 Tax=Xanthomonas cannabis TaxID=1885674 RepID=A0ABR6JMN7_9XANT|nr:hypothetical protein [Xanthomonas cannabis]MBB5522656.1 hypothetical protein [Xanthomonas cannabis]